GAELLLDAALAPPGEQPGVHDPDGHHAIHDGQDEDLGAGALAADHHDGEHDQHQRQQELADVPPRVDHVAQVALDRAAVPRREEPVVTAQHALASLGPLLPLTGLHVRTHGLGAADEGPPVGRLLVAPLWGGTVLGARACLDGGGGLGLGGGLLAGEHPTTVCRVAAIVGRVTTETPTTENRPDDRRADLAARVKELMPGVRSDLEALTRIPSVSLDSFDQQHVDESAQAVADLLTAEGMEVRIVREGGRPAVIGHLPGPEGAPTVLLYAHHDVQPPGDEADWNTPMFEPTEIDGRLYGRGIADDKAGVMAHIAALRAHGGRPPVGVTVFVEGEEEIASESLPTSLERHGDSLKADAIVLADSQNWKIGVPALTTTLRGLVRVVVEVKALDHGVHSGKFGGTVPD